MPTPIVSACTTSPRPTSSSSLPRLAKQRAGFRSAWAETNRSMTARRPRTGRSSDVINHLNSELKTRSSFRGLRPAPSASCVGLSYQGRGQGPKIVLALQRQLAEFKSAAQGLCPRHQRSWLAPAAATDWLYNREWHIVVKQRKLSGIFEDYIIKDLDTSALDDAGDESPVTEPPPPDFPPDDDFTLEFKIQPTPMIGDDETARAHKRAFARKVMAPKQRKIMPLLTPDNYASEITKLVRKAEHRLWFQNQSLSINKFPSEAYRELLDALKEKAWEIDDCRIIMRDYRRANTIDYLRILDRDGFPMQKIRGMKNCHTKGILIDGRWTVIGSHNWTNEGTNFNRDASLIIDDPEVTKYFEEVVEHDWNSLSYSIDYDMENAGGRAAPARREHRRRNRAARGKPQCHRRRLERVLGQRGEQGAVAGHGEGCRPPALLAGFFHPAPVHTDDATALEVDDGRSGIAPKCRGVVVE